MTEHLSLKKTNPTRTKGLLVIIGILLISLTTITMSFLQPLTYRGVSALRADSVSPSSGPITGGGTTTIYGDFIRKETRISASNTNTCAIGSDNKAYCWGDNTLGQLGNGTTANSPVPVAVSTAGVLQGKTLAEISSGTSSFTCTTDTDGKVYCWGVGTAGQLGNGTTANSPVPVAVSTAGVLQGKVLKHPVTGYAHVCALDVAGQAYCWGSSDTGQLGNGTTANSPVPVAVSTAGVLQGKTLAAISAGRQHTCALDVSGQAYCWGYNDYGQLGNGTTIESQSPSAVSTAGVLQGKKLASIVAGDYHTCATDTAGQAYCWGYNDYGQLGNGTTIESQSPSAVSTAGVLQGKTIIKLHAYSSHTCAIDTANKAYCWGINSYGQLGNGTTANSSVPVAATTGILATAQITSITIGNRHACIMNTTGEFYCWGYNGNGQLGNNTTTNNLAPQKVHDVTNADTPIASALPAPQPRPEYVVSVLFGTAACANVVIASDGRSLTCTAPPYVAGIVDISVQDGINSSMLVNAYEYREVATPLTPSTGYN